MDRTDDAVDATDPLEIAPGELRSLVEGDASEGLRLVDVRPPRQYARGHLPGSENVPLGRLTDRAEDLDGAERVVCVCQEGIASLQAARLLAAYGGVERAESLAGGIDEWPGELATGGERSERGDDAAPF